jgi:pyruvate carboxylase
MQRSPQLGIRLAQRHSSLDGALRVAKRAHRTADPAEAGQVAAPTARLISGIAVQMNQVLERGGELLTLKVMKMQFNISAPIAGRVMKLLVPSGQHVETKDLLVTFTP